MKTLKPSSRRSQNTERQRGEIISEWCPYFHHHNEMTGGKKHKRGFGFLSSFPPQADVSPRYFMEWLLSQRQPQLLQTVVSHRWWQGLCRGFMTPSVVVPWEACTCLRSLTITCMKKRLSLSWRLSSVMKKPHSLEQIWTAKQKQRRRQQTVVFLNVPERRWRLCPDLPPYAADSYLGVLICLLFIADC